ncbi:MAG: biopolymer transporter ExbD [Pirellulales bacterium]|nr:biopolymer transporter ExbD [Pirellulales bacterium]
MNLTSMIDVVFLLIVFFMGAARFTDPERDIDLRLPEVAQAASGEGATAAKQVAVYADGRFSLDRHDVTLDELTSQLAAACRQRPATSVVILGDAGCPFQQVADALAACQQAGVSRLAVSVKIAQGATGVRR